MSVKTEEDEEGNSGSGVAIIETNRFGFILGNGETDSDAPCPEIVRHRENKWLGLIKQWEQVIEKKSSKVKGQCQKGIPTSVRAKCWPLLCGAMERMKKNDTLYKKLVDAPDNQGWTDIIKRDTDRQFPFHEMFQSKDGHGQKDLLQVLKAYTQYRPEEGYCQAQGPVAAVLLMNMPAEEAFWCLAQISELYLPGYYSPLLEGVLFDAAVLSSVLKKLCPAAHKHLQNQGVEPLMFATDWLMCLYSRHLPFNTLLRVWDLFFCYGVRVLFQVAVVLVRRCLGEGRQRKECDGQMETLEHLRGVKERVKNDQTDAFIHEVCSVPLSSTDLQKQTEKEMEKWKKERPDSTFDPRGRCHGYRMAWERVQNKQKETEKKERQKGNLTLPLMRSHSSLSPYLMRKKWRKRGSRTDSEEWDGGERIFSQGVMEESDYGEMRRRSMCGVVGEQRARQDRLADELHTHKQKDSNMHANISLVVSSSTESDVFEEGHQHTECMSQMQSVTERDSQQEDKLHTHKEDTERSLNQQKDNSSTGQDKCDEERIIVCVVEESIQTHHEAGKSCHSEKETCPDQQHSEKESCPDQQSAEKETCPDQQSAEKESCPDQQSAEKESCPDQQSAEKESCPDQQSAEKETCPDQQSAEKETCPDQQSAEKESCPDQQSAEKETCPDQQSAEKESCPDQQSAEKETCPDQQHLETETCPDQQSAENETCPDQQSAEKESCPDQQHLEKETCPEQQSAENETCPDQQHLEKETCPDQQHLEKETCPDQNTEKEEHQDKQNVKIQISSEFREENIPTNETLTTNYDPQVEDIQANSGKKEEEIQSHSNYQVDVIQTVGKQKEPEPDVLQKVIIHEDNQQEDQRSHISREQPQENIHSERQEKEDKETYATGENPADADEKQEVSEESEITQHSEDDNKGSQDKRQKISLDERDCDDHTPQTCEAVLTSSSIETEQESEFHPDGWNPFQGPYHPVHESQPSNPEHSDTDVIYESRESEHSQVDSKVEVTFGSGNPKQSEVGATGGADIPKSQGEDATVASIDSGDGDVDTAAVVTYGISELNPENSEVRALSKNTKCCEFISTEESGNLENKGQTDACISGSPESAEHVATEFENSGGKVQLEDGSGNLEIKEMHVTAESGKQESNDMHVTTGLGHPESNSLESAIASDHPESNAECNTDDSSGSGNLHNSASAIPANSQELESPSSITPSKTPNIPPAQLRLRRTSSSRSSYPTILSEDTFRVPKQMDAEHTHTAKHMNTPKAEGSCPLTCHPETNTPFKPDTAQETHAQPDSQTKTSAPKRLGLFRRLRGDNNKPPVPKILIQDFSEKEEHLTSKERRRRKREKERKEREEKERKKREKEMEKDKEKERKKPQTRGKSFQVLNRKCPDNDVSPGNSNSQTISSRRNSAPFSDSYF